MLLAQLSYQSSCQLPFQEVGQGIRYALSDSILSSIRNNYRAAGYRVGDSSIAHNPSIVKSEPEISGIRMRCYIYDESEIDMSDVISTDDRAVNIETTEPSSKNWVSGMSKQDIKLIGDMYQRVERQKICSGDLNEMLSNGDYTTGVKLEQWPEAKSVIDKWILPWSDDTRSDLYDWISTYSSESFVGLYINRLNNIREELLDGDTSRANELLSEASLTSGGIAFYGSMGLSLLETGKVCNVDHLFYFTTLYMLTDYWLDDPKIKDRGKISTMRTLIDLIENPKRVYGQGCLSIMTDRLVKLIEEVPESYHVLKNVFYAEIASAMIQRQSNLPLDVYLKICEWKGGAMLQSMQVICGSKADPSGYLVGACIQLIDDMHDIDEDVADGIHTVATHVKSLCGNLDPLFLYTVRLMSRFDTKHTFFKPFILGMMMHSIAIIPYFSTELHNICKEFFPFDRTYDLRAVIYDRMLRVLRS